MEFNIHENRHLFDIRSLNIVCGFLNFSEGDPGCNYERDYDLFIIQKGVF